MIDDGLGPLRSAHLLSRFAELSAEGMIAFDRELHYVLWNPRMEQLTGRSSESVMGRQVFEVFPFLSELGEEQHFRNALAGRISVAERRPFPLDEGSGEFLYNATYYPWMVGGLAQGGIVLLQDVTTQTRTTEQLAETERRFQNMADVAPVMLWMSETDGLCTFFNQTWLNFTGRPLSEEWGVGWAENIHFEDFQNCIDTYVAAFNKREVFEMEYRLKRADGTYRWIMDRGTPRYTPDGTFAGFIGSCVDITERKELEESLRRAVRARDEFLSIASHELRTPLTSLQLQIENLLRSVAKRPEEMVKSGRLAKHSATVREQTLRLGGLVNVLLDVSRISEGRLSLELEPTDLGSLVQETVNRLSESARGAGVTLSVALDGKLEGRWDRLRAEQVVTNLLSNAIKYGAGKPISVSVRDLGDTIELSVSDKGLGIAPEHQERVFDRFTRFAPTRHYGGFGLGLWITREIVQAHGGSISVKSQLGVGTLFTVVLPRQPHSNLHPELHRTTPPTPHPH